MASNIDTVGTPKMAEVLYKFNIQRYSFQDKKSGVNNFPIIKVDDNSRMELTIESSGINATIIDINKKVQVQLFFEK